MRSPGICSLSINDCRTYSVKQTTTSARFPASAQAIQYQERKAFENRPGRRRKLISWMTMTCFFRDAPQGRCPSASIKPGSPQPRGKRPAPKDDRSVPWSPAASAPSYCPLRSAPWYPLEQTASRFHPLVTNTPWSPAENCESSSACRWVSPPLKNVLKLILPS